MVLRILLFFYKFSCRDAGNRIDLEGIDLIIVLALSLLFLKFFKGIESRKGDEAGKFQGERHWLRGITGKYWRGAEGIMHNSMLILSDLSFINLNGLTSKYSICNCSLGTQSYSAFQHQCSCNTTLKQHNKHFQTLIWLLLLPPSPTPTPHCRRQHTPCGYGFISTGTL